MGTLEQTCIDVVTNLRAAVKNRTQKLYEMQHTSTPEVGIIIPDGQTTELSNSIVCRELTQDDPDGKKIEWALNSALQKGIEVKRATSLGYYTFKIDSKGRDGVNRVIITFERPVTPMRFDRDMARLLSILTGKDVFAGR